MILCVCLSPALQRTLYFQSLESNQVNRADKHIWSGGGKGVNVARVIKQLNHQSIVLLPLGGWSGQKLCATLEQENIPVHTIQTDKETRICETLIDQSRTSHTELVQEPESVTEFTRKDILKAFDILLSKSQFVVLSGTIPQGFFSTIYKTLIEKAHAYQIPVILDATEIPLMQAIEAKPWLVKPNWQEVEKSLNQSISNDKEMYQAMALLAERGASNVLVTQSGPEALLLYDHRYYKLQSPNLNVMNPIGSGDAFAAGIAVKYSQTGLFPDGIRYGIACASANVLTPLAGHVQLDMVEKIYSQVICKSYKD